MSHAWSPQEVMEPVFWDISVTNPSHVCQALGIGAMPGVAVPLLLAGHCHWITLLQLCKITPVSLNDTIWIALKKAAALFVLRWWICLDNSIWGTKKPGQQDHQTTINKQLHFSLRHWELKSIWLSDMKNCCCSHFKQVVCNILQKSSGAPASFKVSVALWVSHFCPLCL